MQDVLERLHADIGALGTAKKYAESVGISTPYLSDVLAGRRLPGPAIRAQMGLEKVTVYREVGGDSGRGT